MINPFSKNKIFNSKTKLTKQTNEADKKIKTKRSNPQIISKAKLFDDNLAKFLEHIK